MSKKENYKLGLKQHQLIIRIFIIVLIFVSVILLVVSNDFLNDYAFSTPRYMYAQLSLSFVLVPVVALIMSIIVIRGEDDKKRKIVFVIISLIALFLALKLLLNGFAVNFLS